MWLPEDRAKYPHQAQFAGTEAHATRLGVAYTELSTLEIKNARQAFIGLDIDGDDPFRVTVSAAGNDLRSSFNAEEGGTLTTPRAEVKAGASGAPVPTPGAGLRKPTTIKAVHNKIAVADKSREAVAELMRLQAQLPLTIAVIRRQAGITAELPALQLLHPELAIAAARYAREQAQVAQGIEAAVRELLMGGQAFV